MAGTYMMVVNRDFIEPAVLRLKFREAPEDLFEVSKQNGKEQSTTGYSRITGELDTRVCCRRRLYCFA